MPVGVKWKRKFRLLMSSQPLPHSWHSWHSWHSFVPDLQLHQCLHLLSPPSLRHRRSHQCWDLKLDGTSSFTITQDRLATSSPSNNQNKQMNTANFFNTKIYGYGSIPINTIFRGMKHPFTSYFDIHQGYKVLTHCHINVC